MTVPRVLVAGAFGQGNPGDESILRALAGGLGGCAVSATSAPDRLAGAPCRLIAADDTRAVAAAAIEADLVVATGTVFKTLHPSTGRHPLALLANTLALGAGTRVRGRPVAMVGVGAGHLESRTARVLTRATAAIAGPMSVRDEESVAVLRGAGVRRHLGAGADVVWSLVAERLPERPPVGDGRGSREVVVCVSHLAGGSPLVSSVRGALMGLQREGFAVAVQPWQLPQDFQMSVAMVEGLDGPVEMRCPPADVVEAARSLRGASLVIGLRFHSLVAAACAGLPFVAVGHEPKLVGLARRMGQKAVAPSASGDVLAALCREAVAGPPPPPAAVGREIDLAEQAIAGLRSLAFQRAARRWRRSSLASAPAS